MNDSSILHSRYPTDPKAPLPSGWGKNKNMHFVVTNLTEPEDAFEAEEYLPIATSDDSNEESEETLRKKIVYLEKSLHFIQNQHKSILSSLQKEIDKLKNENQDLQFQLVMLQGDDASATSDVTSPTRKPSGNAVLRTHVEELKQEVERLKQRNSYLDGLLKKQEAILKTEKEKYNDLSHKSQALISKNNSLPANDTALFNSSESNIVHNITLGHMKVLLEPLMIMELNTQDNEFITTKEPTLKECEAIIKYMVMKNQLLKEENEKLTEERNRRLSTRGSKSTTSRPTTPAGSVVEKKYSARTIPQLPPIHPGVTVPLSLPVLKQSLGNNIAERHRRTRSLQKNRLKMAEHSLFRYE